MTSYIFILLKIGTIQLNVGLNLQFSFTTSEDSGSYFVLSKWTELALVVYTILFLENKTPNFIFLSWLLYFYWMNDNADFHKSGFYAPLSTWHTNEEDREYNFDITYFSIFQFILSNVTFARLPKTLVYSYICQLFFFGLK